jgi:hypothetical protein
VIAFFAASSRRQTRPAAILTQLRSRRIAEEQIETYNRQEKAAVKERELREAEARAKQQTTITELELSIITQQNQGKAEEQVRAYGQVVSPPAPPRAEAQAVRDGIRARLGASQGPIA